MSLPLPILNVRVLQSLKDSFHLLAGRFGVKPGPLMREWLTERLVQEYALATYRAVGLTELRRRLAQPSPVFTQSHDSTLDVEGAVQTDVHFVTPFRLAGGRA